MKDIINRIIRISLGGALLAYLFYLFVNSSNIAWEAISNYNMLIFIITGVISFYIFFSGIKIVFFKKPKFAQIVFGLLLMMFGYYFIEDNPDKFVFIGDILILIGVLTTILGPTGLLVFEGYLKKKEEESVEVVEV